MEERTDFDRDIDLLVDAADEMESVEAHDAVMNLVSLLIKEEQVN